MHKKYERVVTEPRLGTEEYNRIATQALHTQDLQVYGVFGEGKLHVSYYRKSD